jgi:hypothetical protein
MKRLLILGIIVALFIVAMPVMAEDENDFVVTAGAQPTSASLGATVTATPHWYTVYDWTIEKSASNPTLTLATGEPFTETYTVIINKDEASGVTSAYIDGQVCVTNSGTDPTDNLAITAVVKDGYPPPSDIITSASVDVSGLPNIPADSSPHCYDYRVDLPLPTDTYGHPQPHAGGAYKVTADVTITNHAGHYGTAWGPSPSADFTFPSAVDVECVDVADSLVESVNQKVCDDATFTYTWTIEPYAVCGDYTVDNTATYVSDVPENSANTGSDTASVAVHVPCAGGCTLTAGYWMTHSLSGPAPYDDNWANLASGAATSFYSSGQSYLGVLQTPPTSGNAYYILAFQYIGAKLNILNGADGSAITSDMIYADNFFASHSPIDKLSKTDRATAVSKATVLANYNLGYIGPGHCSE